MKKIKPIIHVGQEYQIKYFTPIAKHIGATVASRFKGHENSIVLDGKRGFMKFLSENEHSFCMSGSGSNKSPIYSIPCVAASCTKKKKLIWIWHSYLLEKSKHKVASPKFHGQYSVLPEYFYSVLGLEKSEKHFEYKGHFKSAFHHESPPSVGQQEKILYLPDVSSSIERIKHEISKFDLPVLIRPHPGEYTSDPIGRANGFTLGMIDEYKKHFGSENISEKDANVIDDIDQCSHVISNYGSSILVEALIRAKLYDTERTVCMTECKTILARKAGINVSKDPTMKLFASANEEMIRQCTLDLDELVHNFLDSIKMAVSSEKLSKEERKIITETFYNKNLELLEC